MATGETGFGNFTTIGGIRVPTSSLPIAPDETTTSQSSPLVPNEDSTSPATETPTTSTPTTSTPTMATLPQDPTLGGAITTASIARGEQVGTAVSTGLTQPQVPDAGIQEFTPLTEQPSEITDPTDPRFQVAQGIDPDVATAQAAPDVGVAPIEAATIEGAQAAAAQGQAATQTELAAGTAATAALGNLPPEAMVDAQMEELTEGLKTGEIPLWAQPSVDAIEAQLAARGLSRSSVGQAALSNAIIQAALPIAQQNAQAVQQNFAQDKQNLQQTNLFNAQASLTLQSQSLTNEQQTALSNTTFRQQSMLSNQASENASRQFNAASQNQTDQFMTNLTTQVQSQNAARVDAMAQFNAQNENAMTQFTEQNKFAREQFNAQNATQVEQSNLQWRRQINQTNTAGVNAVNQANAMNAFNLSNQALTFMWQEMRDSAKWSFEASQNDLQRAAALAQAALGNEAAGSAATASAISSLGTAALNVWAELRST